MNDHSTPDDQPVGDLDPESATRGDFRRRVRDAVLAVARDQAVERGWSHVRIGQVAVAAAVARPTLYREFGSKDGVGEALVLAEADRIFGEITTLLDRHSDVPAGIRAAATYTLNEAAENPFLRGIVKRDGGEGVGLLPFLTTRSTTILRGGRDVLTTWIQRVDPGHDPEVLEELTESVTRLVVSHIVVTTAPYEVVGDRLERMTRTLLAAS